MYAPSPDAVLPIGSVVSPKSSPWYLSLQTLPFWADTLLCNSNLNFLVI
jgi:hypothetical protein